MDVLRMNPVDGIRSDLVLTRLELTAARASQAAKDTPAARQRVADARARADSLLDMWNELALTPA